jgi:hypothetical protein
LIPEVEGAQIRAISGGDLSIKVAVSLISEYEKYSGSLLQFKGQVSIDSKAFTSTPMEAALFQANPIRRAM